MSDLKIGSRERLPFYPSDASPEQLRYLRQLHQYLNRITANATDEAVSEGVKFEGLDFAVTLTKDGGDAGGYDEANDEWDDCTYTYEIEDYLTGETLSTGVTPTRPREEGREYWYAGEDRGASHGGATTTVGIAVYDSGGNPVLVEALGEIKKYTVNSLARKFTDWTNFDAEESEYISEAILAKQFWSKDTNFSYVAVEMCIFGPSRSLQFAQIEQDFGNEWTYTITVLRKCRLLFMLNADIGASLTFKLYLDSGAGDVLKKTWTGAVSAFTEDYFLDVEEGDTITTHLLYSTGHPDYVDDDHDERFYDSIQERYWNWCKTRFPEIAN